MYVRAVQYPIPIRVRHEDIAAFFDSLQYNPIRSSSNTLCRQQSRSLCAVRFDHCTSLLKPICNQIGLLRYTVLINVEKVIDIAIADFRAQPFATKERRVAAE